MAAGDTMQGRRLPDREGFKLSGVRPGDYVKVPIDGSPLWYCCTPNGELGNLGAHSITEHEDGTITVSPSILVTGGENNVVWHGYLEHGIWREV